MTDSDNGSPRSLRDIVEEVVRGAASPPPSLLRDMEQQLPFVRSFLLGGERNGHHWPVGTIKLARRSDMLLARMHVAALEVESELFAQSWDELWSTLDGMLGTDTVPWRADWKRTQREERKQLS